MKLSCSRATLATAFQAVSGVIPTRTPKPILQNAKLETSNGHAVLVATDQEVGIRYRLNGADVTAPGDVLLPTNRVLSILREMQGDVVYLETSESGTVIRGERAQYKLGAENPAEFPSVAEFDEQNCVNVAAGVLKQMIRRTVFATDTESTRYALGGVLIELKGESIVMAATDTRRLAVVRGQCAAAGNIAMENAVPVIPSKALALIERTLADETEPVSLAIRNNDALVRTSAATIYSRLVEGRFPRYQEVIPARSSIAIDLVVGPFYSAVRQAQIVTSEESRGVSFEFESGLMTLVSRAAEIGESKVELPISYEGSAIAITFDPRYVADFLRVLEPEQSIKLELTDAESAAVFRTEDGYTYIVMPLSRDR
ncbi:MAG TPA: DNA polymerase III subunit beta [Planctomycetaceae bacterium]|nr:DNA polymerase III subunit beta [Planctomycetaceae bacterium]